MHPLYAAMADKVIELGYASSMVRDEKNGTIDFVFTERGHRMKEEFKAISSAIRDGDHLDPVKLKTFACLFIVSEKFGV